MITITGRIPSKKNSRTAFNIKGRCLLLPNQNYREWHRESSKQLLAFTEQKLALGSSIVILFYAPDKRATDLTNKAESIMDLLKDNDFITDDNWFVVSEVRLRFAGVDKDNPRAEVYTAEEFETMMSAGLGGLFTK